jgi:hypothetical protein
MSSDVVECQAFVLGTSSLMRLTFRKTKLPLDLSKVIWEAVEAYWKDCGYRGWQRIMESRIEYLLSRLPEKDTNMLADEPQASSDYNVFILALFQEIEAFFELCALNDFRFMAYTSYGTDHVTAIFTKEPVMVSKKSTGAGKFDITLHRIEKVEDE